MTDSFSLSALEASLPPSSSSRNAQRTQSQQWFASLEKGEDSEPDEPDLARFLTLMATHALPITSSASLDFGNSRPGAALGGFGQVRMATWSQPDQPARAVAVKQFLEARLAAGSSSSKQVVKQHARLFHDLFFEIEIMACCRHRNVTRVLGVSFEESERAHRLIRPLLLLEPADAECPDLAQFFRNPAAGCWALADQTAARVDEAAAILSGIADGLAALHSLGVVHADLKPENVLMFRAADGGASHVPKLCDFGLSGLSASREAPRGGTRRWNAPECLPLAPTSLVPFAITPSRDIYAFGLLAAYVLQKGRGPFAVSDAVGDLDRMKLDPGDAALKNVWAATQPFIGDDPRGAQFKMLLESTLRMQPAKRWTTLLQVRSILCGQTVESSRTRGFEQAEFIPFGSAPLTSSDTAAPMAIFSHVDLMLLVSNMQEVPLSLRTALASQLERAVLTTPIDDLTPAHRTLAKLFIPPERHAFLLEKALDFQKILSWSLDAPDLDALRSLDEASKQAGQWNRWFVDCTTQAVQYARETASEQAVSRAPVTRKAEFRNSFAQLHMAAGCGHLDQIRFLVEDCSVPVDVLGPLDQTPLHVAAIMGESDAVQLLLQLGADANALTGGRPAGAGADANVFTEGRPVRVIIVPSLPPLLLAVAQGHTGVVAVLAAHPATNLWARHHAFYGQTAAHMAAERGFAACLRVLLETDAALALSLDQRKRTPLHRVKGDLECAQLLVRAGADVNAVDNTGLTPVHKAFATAAGHPGATTFRGADRMWSDWLQLGASEADLEWLSCTETKQQHAFQAPTRDQALSALALQSLGLGSLYNHVFLAAMCGRSSSFARRILAETPAGHDPFIQVKVDQMVRCAPNPESVREVWATISKTMLEAMRVVNRGCGDESQEAWKQSQALLDLYRPTFRGSALVSFEINVRHFASRMRRQKLATRRARWGQDNDDDDVEDWEKDGYVTILRLKKGRDVLRYLLDHGGDPTIIDLRHYSPECYAYTPDETKWTMSIHLGLHTHRVPETCWHVFEPTNPRQTKPKGPFLILRPFHGRFSLWTWIPSILPCPSGAVLVLSAARTSSALDCTIVVEARMYPPNDAFNKEEILVLEIFQLHNLIPQADTLYDLCLCIIPIKHKCDLVINIRSGDAPAQVGGLILTSLALIARVKMLPSIDISRPYVSTTSLDMFPLGKYTTTMPDLPHPYPDFPPGTHWWPAPQPEPVAADEMRSLVEGWSSMSLSEPNPNVYTRNRLGVDADAVHTIYGEKCFYFSEEENEFTHADMRLLSDVGKDEFARLRLEEFIQNAHQILATVPSPPVPSPPAADKKSHVSSLRAKMRKVFSSSSKKGKK